MASLSGTEVVVVMPLAPSGALSGSHEAVTTQAIANLGGGGVTGPAVAAVSATILNTVTSAALTSYTFAQTDNNVTYLSSDASNGAAVCPAGLTVGTVVTIYQGGAGQIQFTAGSGATVVNASSNTRTRTQYSPVQIRVISTNTWALTGDTAP